MNAIVRTNLSLDSRSDDTTLRLLVSPVQAGNLYTWNGTPTCANIMTLNLVVTTIGGNTTHAGGDVVAGDAIDAEVGSIVSVVFCSGSFLLGRRRLSIVTPFPS